MVRGDLIAGCVGLLLLAFRYGLLRAVPPLRRFLDGGPWGDALAYFLQIQYYRRHSGSEPDTRCLFRGKSVHTPSWYHRFALRLCSDATLWSKPWVPNLVLYGLGVVCLLLLAAPIAGGGPPATWPLLGLTFLAQTDNSRFDERTAHYLTIQPRLLGAVALSVHAALFALLPSPLVTIVGGSLALLVAINTSVFSRQVAYGVLPVAALLSWNALPLLNLAIATGLALLVNRTEFVESFGAHWRYARWYFRTFYAPRPGSGLAYLIRRSLAPPARFLPRYADSALALVLLLLLVRRGGDPFAMRAAAMIGAALLVCGATALRKLASLGECWRYVSFSCWMLTPLALVHAVLALHIPLLPAGLAAAAVLLHNLYRSFQPSEQLSNPNAEVVGLLRGALGSTAPQPSVWWSAHFRYGSIAVALGFGAATFEIQGTDLSEDVMVSLFARYPYLHCNEAFFDAHRVTHLLISKNEWPADLYGSIDRLVGLHRVLAENSHFVILARAHA
jgi:hypothetical protein